jgi:receptor-type tyrosine-protein phosphatase N
MTGRHQQLIFKKPFIVTLVLSLCYIAVVNSLETGQNGEVRFPRENRKGFVGCSFSSLVCNEDEFCFDDYLFGQCISVTSVSYLEHPLRFNDLTPDAQALLELEMDRLFSYGYQWLDDYTQCTFQSLLNTIQFGYTYDRSTCNNLEEPTAADKDIGNNNIAAALPLLQDDDFYLETQPAFDPSTLLLKEIEDSEIPESPPNEPLIIPDAGVEAMFIEPGLYPDVDPFKTEAESDDPFKIEAERDDPFEIRAEPDYPFETEAEPDGPFLIRAEPDIGGEEEYDGSNGADDDDTFFEDAQLMANPLTTDGISYIVDSKDIGNSLAHKLFNRNERLDVKKPGPFFPNSANNFFLDKLIRTSAEKVEASPLSNDSTAEDLGQVEYEMPLLAPAKDKRELPIIFNKGQPTNNAYVHIGLKNRLKTLQQGEELIDTIARAMGIPPAAFRDKTIDSQHVQFEVDANPEDMDAIKIATKLDEDVGLRNRIERAVGVAIDKAAAGEKSAGPSLVIPTGRNAQLLILIITLVSTAAALFIVGLTLFLVRKLKKKNTKEQKISEEEEKGKVQTEYKQLCRDWSRSSKTGNRASAAGSSASAPSSSTQPQQQQQDADTDKPAAAPTTSGSASSGDKSPRRILQNQDSKSSDRSSTSSCPADESNSTNLDISTGHMVLAYMEDHLKNKQRLEQEWVALCGYEAEPSATTIAFRAENKKKNRYPDKLPYDHNRAILNSLLSASNSDYINGSMVTDHDPRNPSYIVTQGPLNQTLADFWQMVWEQGCVVIVMLSRLQDNGYKLCERYWPEEGSATYYVFEVHLVSEHIWCEDYLVRSLYLKNTRTGETRTVTQFHFRSWSAHGVPSSTKALLEFRRKVNKSYRGRSAPIVVHCSDGVGRSGTYVLLDMVLNRMSKGCKEIDIAATLEHVRDQRGGCVQSKQQFEFCLMAVAEEVHAILKAIPQ